MPDYYDLGVRFWEGGLDKYANSLGFKSICSFSKEGNGVEIAARKLDDFRFSTNEKKILVSSDDPEILKKACRSEVSMLLFGRFLPDTGLVRAAAENKKPFEIPLSFILEKKGADRAFVMSKIGFFMKLCNKYRADFILTSGAKDKLSMKSPADIIAIGEVLGLSHDQVVKSISIIPEYVLEG